MLPTCACPTIFPPITWRWWGRSQLFRFADTVSSQDWRHLLHHHLVHYNLQVPAFATAGIGQDVMDQMRDPSDFYPVQLFRLVHLCQRTHSALWTTYSRTVIKRNTPFEDPARPNHATLHVTFNTAGNLQERTGLHGGNRLAGRGGLAATRRDQALPRLAELPAEAEPLHQSTAHRPSRETAAVLDATCAGYAVA